MFSPQSVLIIGATGRTGGYLIKALAKSKNNNNNTKVYAFCRNPSKLDEETKQYCDGFVEGNARNPNDIEKAVSTVHADTIMIAIGSGDDTSQTDLRTVSAEAVVQVMSKNQNLKAVVISSHGAGGSRVKIGFGIGKFVEHHLRYVFRDHDGQEAAFLSSRSSSSNSDVAKRTMIFRPTALTDGESTGYDDGKVVIFGDYDKSPAIHLDREDLATYVVEQLYRQDPKVISFGSKPKNIAWIKNPKTKKSKKAKTMKH